MRDDIPALGIMRMFPEATMSAAAQRTPSAVATNQPSGFAAALARANQARATQSAQQAYSSPLKSTAMHTTFKTTHPHPLTHVTKPTTTSLTQKPQTLRQTTAPKPLPPLQRTQSTTSTANSTGPMSLNAYPHPNGDNGRGMHWIPTTSQPQAVVDRFVAEAQRMGVKWVTFLNDGANIGQNDYLVSKLVGAGIEPIMRLYSPKLEPIQGDIESMVRHYVSMGVHYFQPFNEPNLSVENPDGVPSVDHYLNAWVPAAQAIIHGGGLPGFGSLSPGGDVNDIDFLKQALDGLKSRGQLGLLDKGWLSMHNYTHNHPIEQRSDTDGFFKFRAYHDILNQALGRDVPIIGTEGGTFVGEHEDTTLPAVDANTAARWATQAYTYMRDQREPWNFAYSFWTIANEAGGGKDAQFSQEALFKPDGGGVSSVVNALRAMA